MRKFSLMLALLAGMMLPVTAVAQPASSSKSKTSNKKSSKKGKAKEVEEVIIEEPPVDDGLTFSNEQILLNNQAVEAVSSGNFKKAEQLFK